MANIIIPEERFCLAIGSIRPAMTNTNTLKNSKSFPASLADLPIKRAVIRITATLFISAGSNLIGPS